MTQQARDLAAALLIEMECGGNLDRYLDAYQDGGGVWTLGCGSTVMPSGRPVRRGDTVTSVTALSLLQAQIADWDRVVGKSIQVKLADAQSAVLISFVHQEGPNALPGSVLADMLNATLITRGAGQLNGWVIGRERGVRRPILGLMRRQETQRRMMLGAALKPTKIEVWALGYAALLPLYTAACEDAIDFRRSTRLTAKQTSSTPSYSHAADSTASPSTPPSEADVLMADELSGHLIIGST